MTPPEVLALLSTEAEVPLQTDDSIKKAVRDLLRQNGFKPTGRSKPASEYLIRAIEQGKLSSINLAVDVLNIVSLHSGLPISVVDVDLIGFPMSVRVALPGTSYVFNASGQSMDISGLICLFDNAGPCANAVKDSQRTKTSNQTTRTISVIWGTRELPGRTDATFEWYRRLLTNQGTTVDRVAIDT